MVTAILYAAWGFLYRRVDHAVIACELAYIRLRRRLNGGR